MFMCLHLVSSFFSTSPQTYYLGFCKNITYEENSCSRPLECACIHCLSLSSTCSHMHTAEVRWDPLIQQIKGISSCP